MANWRPIAAVISIVGVFIAGYSRGIAHEETIYKAAQLKAQQHVTEVVKKQDQISIKSSSDDASKIQGLIAENDKLKSEAIRYAKKSKCRIPTNLVRVFNAATGNLPSVPDATSKPDVPPSEVALDSVSSVIVENDSISRKNSQQLSDLEVWLIEQCKLYHQTNCDIY